ncbi:hypothetical protein WME94_25165 [Sorangium sp. So ce429]
MSLPEAAARALRLPIRRLTNYELSVDQDIEIHQREVLYAGLNPF